MLADPGRRAARSAARSPRSLMAVVCAAGGHRSRPDRLSPTRSRTTSTTACSSPGAAFCLLARAVLGARASGSPWAFMGVAIVCWTAGGRLLVGASTRARSSAPYPARRRSTGSLLPGELRGAGPARALAGIASIRGEPLARRCDRGALAVVAFAAAFAFRADRRRHRRATTAAVATNLAYPLGDVCCCSAWSWQSSRLSGWRPGRAWLAARRRPWPHGLRRRHLSLPDAARAPTCEGRFSTRSGPRRRCWWALAAWQPRKGPGRAPSSRAAAWSRCRSSAALVARRAAAPRPLRPAANPRALGLTTADRGARARRGWRSSFRDNQQMLVAAARRPTPTRSPAFATGAPDGGPQASSCRWPPRRTGVLLILFDLDGFKQLQRRLRPPGRRRPAGAARSSAGRSRSRPTAARLPARRRRVLRAASSPARPAWSRS